MITTKIIFDRRGWCKQKKKGIVEVRVTIDRQSIYISTGIQIYKNEWAAGRVVNRPDAQMLNDRLATIYEKVCQGVNDCIKLGIPLDTENIKKLVWRVIESQSDESTFIDWIEKQLPKRGITEGTAKH